MYKGKCPDWMKLVLSRLPRRQNKVALSQTYYVRVSRFISTHSWNIRRHYSGNNHFRGRYTGEQERAQPLQDQKTFQTYEDTKHPKHKSIGMLHTYSSTKTTITKQPVKIVETDQTLNTAGKTMISCPAVKLVCRPARPLIS